MYQNQTLRKFTFEKKNKTSTIYTLKKGCISIAHRVGTLRSGYTVPFVFFVHFTLRVIKKGIVPCRFPIEYLWDEWIEIRWRAILLHYKTWQHCSPEMRPIKWLLKLIRSNQHNHLKQIWWPTHVLASISNGTIRWKKKIVWKTCLQKKWFHFRPIHWVVMVLLYRQLIVWDDNIMLPDPLEQTR